jgi:hypothetical protein
MQNKQVLTFIRKLSNNEILDLYQYKDPRFCKDLKKYTLKKIQSLLIKLAEIHLSFEGRPDRFYLSTFINRADNNGLNMLDYCIIAGLDEFPMLFAVLGCELHQNVVHLYESLQLSYDIEDAPKLIFKINSAFNDLKEGQKQNQQTPLIKNKNLQPLGWVDGMQARFKTHKIALLLIIIGISCLIGTPFTVGANSNIGTIILFSVGIPALYAGLSNFQNASIAKRNYDQIEAHNRTTHEGKILRVALELVTQHIFEAENQNRIAPEPARLSSGVETSNKIRTLMFRSRNEVPKEQQKPSFKRLTRSISM